MLELVGNCITPLCSQPGRVVLTASRIYFQPFNVASNSPIQTYQLDKVRPSPCLGLLLRSSIATCHSWCAVVFLEMY